MKEGEPGLLLGTPPSPQTSLVLCFGWTERAQGHKTLEEKHSVSPYTLKSCFGWGE